VAALKTYWLLLLGLTLGIVVLAGVGVGAVWLYPTEVIRALVGPGPSAGDPVARMIVYELRLPRAILAACIGAGLAAAGTAYQGLFRNPLAEPFVVGAASGAALGATPYASS
jgi:iron complex transport system permease protein